MNINSTYRYFLLLIFITGLCKLPLLAQTDHTDYLNEPIQQKQFDDNQWQKLQKTIDYSGKKPKPKAEKKEDWSLPDIPEFPVLARVLKGLALFVLIILLSFLMYHLIQKTNPQNKEKKRVQLEDNSVNELIAIEKLAEQIDQHNIKPYIQKAEQEQNYPLAVRLHFLSLLKELNAQSLIKWKKNYTNNNYLAQMRGKNNFAEFRALTKAYERIWYGEQCPKQKEYEILKAEFDAFSMKKE